MKRNSGFIACLAALALLTLAAIFTPVRAETYTALVQVSPLNETPPITNLNASGGFQITVEVTRDATGNITGGKVSFLGTVQFPGAVTIVGLHIHEGAVGVPGPIRFGSDYSGTNTLVLSNGVGIISKDATMPAGDAAMFAQLLANPSAFYVNLHSSVNQAGALRGQLSELTELQAISLNMTTAEEIPPPPDPSQMGNAVGTLTFSPVRNTQGQVLGGTVWFTLATNFTAGLTFTGLHIHEGAAGVAAGVVINTGVGGGATSIVSANGKSFIHIPVAVPNPSSNATQQAAQIGALTRLLANPAGFYVNIHTSTNPGGVVRAQLTTLNRPPQLALSSRYFLPTGTADATISVLATGIDLLSTVQINGQQVAALPDLNTGNVNVTVPAALLANPGLLNVQVRASNGTLSLPLVIPVAAQASVNAQAVASLEAAGFNRTSVAPESIAAAFGTRLASQTVTATTLPLPLTLDGTTVYVNGVAAPLFFVSAGQINYLLPEGTLNGLTGPASVVVVARDGTVSQGQVLVTNVAPGLFTRTANGLGAPAAVATTDGANFIAISNPDGTPVEIQVGHVVAFFGTGLRFRSTVGTATVGGVASTPPSFVGAQGTALVGLDQLNWTVPQALLGRGEVDLTFTLDGRTTNTVRIKIR